MNKISRLMHFDFHNVVEIKNLAKNFDEKAFAKALKDANVSHINFFASCNNGYCYFPTKVGVIYPTLKKDLFGNVLKECHKQGIKVNAYVHLGLNHVQALKHADWTKDQSVGAERYVEPIDKRKGMRFTNFMCYNRKGYKNYILELVKEILNYQIDGIFFDGFYPKACCCPVCENLMAEESVNTKSPTDVINFQTRKMLEFANDIKAILPKDIQVVFNGFPPEYHLNTYSEYEGNHADTYKNAYLRNLYDNRIFMTGRFCRGWGDYGGIKPKAEFESDLYDCLMNDVELAFGDHLHPVDGVNYELLKTVKDVFELQAKYEPHIKNQRIIAEVGVLCNDFKSLENVTYVGVTALLDELHFTYDIINETNDFNKYGLLILPDDLTLTDNLKAKLDEYFDNGGKILSSGFAGINDDKTDAVLKSHKFIKEIVPDVNTRAFFTFEKPFGIYKDTAWAVYYPAVKIKGKGEKIADYVEPMFEKNEQEVSGVFYNAQGEKSKYQTALSNGKSAHISFEIFKAYGAEFSLAHKELFKRVIEGLITPTIKTNLPSFTKTALAKISDGNLLHIKTTHPVCKNKKAVIEEHTVIKAGAKIQVKGEFASAVTVPDNTPVEIRKTEGYTEIILPEITGYLMIKLS